MGCWTCVTRTLPCNLVWCGVVPCVKALASWKQDVHRTLPGNMLWCGVVSCRVVPCVQALGDNLDARDSHVVAPINSARRRIATLQQANSFLHEDDDLAMREAAAASAAAASAAAAAAASASGLSCMSRTSMRSLASHPPTGGRVQDNDQEGAYMAGVSRGFTLWQMVKVRIVTLFCAMGNNRLCVIDRRCAGATWP